MAKRNVAKRNAVNAYGQKINKKHAKKHYTY